MRFFIDAQLPHQIKYAFIDIGHEALHANELENGMSTSDTNILLELDADVIIVSKDSDFYRSSLIYGKPLKLIYVTVGNASRKRLITIFRGAAEQLADLLSQYDVLELDENSIVGII